MTRKSVTFLVKELNEPGLQGWELVTTLQGRDRKGEPAWTAILKRPYVSDNALPYRPGPAAHGDTSVGEEQQFEPSGQDVEYKLQEVELPEPQESQLPLQDEEP